MLCFATQPSTPASKRPNQPPPQKKTGSEHNLRSRGLMNQVDTTPSRCTNTWTRSGRPPLPAPARARPALTKRPTHRPRRRREPPEATPPAPAATVSRDSSPPTVRAALPPARSAGVSGVPRPERRWASVRPSAAKEPSSRTPSRVAKLPASSEVRGGILFCCPLFLLLDLYLVGATAVLNRVAESVAALFYPGSCGCVGVCWR